jgi:hypothetical protein
VYEFDEDDEDEPQTGQFGFETMVRAPGTQSLDNLVPSARYTKKFAKEIQLGLHTAKMLSQYVDVLTPSEFRFKTLHDVEIQDHEKTLAAIPEPWVDAKGYSVHGYATHKHSVNPTGLDEEALATYKIPQEAQKLSNTLAQERRAIYVPVR